MEVERWWFCYHEQLYYDAVFYRKDPRLVVIGDDGVGIVFVEGPDAAAPLAFRKLRDSELRIEG